MTKKPKQNAFAGTLNVAGGLARDTRGNVLIEFAIIAPVLFLFSAGTFAIGINLNRYLQMEHVTRSAANMLSKDIDLSLSTVRSILLKGAGGIPMDKSVIYVSEVALANAGGNAGLPVLLHHVQIGNPAVGPSRLGAPTTDSHGHVVDPEESGTAVATLPAGVVLTGTQRIYVAEFLNVPDDLAFQGLASPGKIYVRTVF